MSTIVGLITNAGLSASQDASLNEGFQLVPTRFGVSEVLGALDADRTSANAGLFFDAPISGRVIVDQNTIKYSLTIPPNQIPANTFKVVREIYLFINDSMSNEILFAIGQPTDVLRYNAADELTLDVEMSIVNLNIIDNFVFKFTQATEISDHNIDPAAHLDIIKMLKKDGVFLPAGAFTFERRGQHFEDNGGNGVEFDGTKAFVTHDGVTFTATFNGTELNGSNITFNGIKNVDTIRSEFNASNYPNTIEHNGVGTEVLVPATVSLTGGSYNVQEKNLVYKDIDGIYKRAVADGTIKSRVAGVAYRADKLVVTHGLVDINTGFPISTPIYLSGVAEGAITNFDTNIGIGLCLGNFIYFTGFAGEITARVSQDFDAVVTNAAGIGQFLTTQSAIAAVPTDGRILITKIEDVKVPIDTLGKNLTIVFNGPFTGWRRFAGLSTSWLIEFDSIPTQGTFRIEWDGQETNDIPFNATALAVANEFNLLFGHNGFSVTGDFNIGFTFTSSDLDIYPLPTFNFSGQNEIQRFDFSNIPNDGTVTFSFEGDETYNHPWDNTAAQLQAEFIALPSLTNVVVTGEFVNQFYEIEFSGGFLQDGNQEQTLINVSKVTLDLAGLPTEVNGTTVIPINAVRIQNGIKPASNLYIGTTLININITSLTTGEQPGQERCIDINSERIQIIGMGRVENFEEGIVLQNSATKLKLECYFENTTRPTITLDKLPGIDYDFETHGFAKDVFSQLRITKHPTNPKRVKISGVNQLLASGIRLSQEINSLLMSFEGAEIDFSADPIEIFKNDGVTPLGENIPRPLISPAEFRWFSVNLIPKETALDQSLEAQVLLLPASSDGVSPELAGKPPFGDKPLGLLAIEGALGDKQLIRITTVRDVNGSLKGKTLVIYHPTESVAFWFSDETLDTFNIEADTGVIGTDQVLFNSTANKVMAGKISVVSSISIDEIDLYIRKNGDPTGNISVRILGDIAGLPDLSNVIAVGASSIDMSEVPSSFTSPVKVSLVGSPVNLPIGDYYVEINGDNLVITAGNLLGWNAEDNGLNVEIFNRDPVSSTWLSDLGTFTANFALIDRIRGVPLLAQGADREVEITNLLENDFQIDVASKLFTSINLDVLFDASVSDNKVDVENNLLGAVTTANMGDTGFNFLVLQEGTNTDVSGIEDITNDRIIQFASGTGGGGGAGDTTDLLERLKNRFLLSFFSYFTPVIFKTSQSDLIDALSTAVFSFASRTFDFQNISDQLITEQLSTDEFLESETLPIKSEVIAYWDIESIDENAIYEVSRDGGTNWQVVSASRIGSSDTVRGIHSFTNELTDSYQNVVGGVPTGQTAFTDINVLSRAFVLDNTSHIKNLTANFGVFGLPVGFIYAEVVEDNAGSPSTDPNDLIARSAFVNIENMVTGQVNFDISFTKKAGTYHVVYKTDQVYKDEYTLSVGANRIEIDSDVTGIIYTLTGLEIDLRVRITSSIASASLSGLGAFYAEENKVDLVNTNILRHLEVFQGDIDNLDTFTLNFLPDPSLLMVFEIGTAQVYRYGAFVLDGNKVIFEPNTFNKSGTITLEFLQILGGSYDNSDFNKALLAANHLGSADGQLDLSIAGRGLFLRRPDGTLRELTIDDNDNISIYSV